MKKFYIDVIKTRQDFSVEIVFNTRLEFETVEKAREFIKEHFAFVSSLYDIRIMHMNDTGQLTAIETLKL